MGEGPGMPQAGGAQVGECREPGRWRQPDSLDRGPQHDGHGGEGAGAQGRGGAPARPRRAAGE